MRKLYIGLFSVAVIILILGSAYFLSHPTSKTAPTSEKRTNTVVPKTESKTENKPTALSDEMVLAKINQMAYNDHDSRQEIKNYYDDLAKTKQATFNTQTVDEGLAALDKKIDWNHVAFLRTRMQSVKDDADKNGGMVLYLMNHGFTKEQAEFARGQMPK